MRLRQGGAGVWELNNRCCQTCREKWKEHLFFELLHEMGSGAVVALLAVVALHFIAGVYAGTYTTGSSTTNDRKIKLTDVPTLTLYSGQYTAARRGAAIPQVRLSLPFFLRPSPRRMIF